MDINGWEDNGAEDSSIGALLQLSNSLSTNKTQNDQIKPWSRHNVKEEAHVASRNDLDSLTSDQLNHTVHFPLPPQESNKSPHHKVFKNIDHQKIAIQTRAAYSNSRSFSLTKIDVEHHRVDPRHSPYLDQHQVELLTAKRVLVPISITPKFDQPLQFTTQYTKFQDGHKKGFSNNSKNSKSGAFSFFKDKQCIDKRKGIITPLAMRKDKLNSIINNRLPSLEKQHFLPSSIENNVTRIKMRVATPPHLLFERGAWEINASGKKRKFEHSKLHYTDVGATRQKKIRHLRRRRKLTQLARRVIGEALGGDPTSRLTSYQYKSNQTKNKEGYQPSKNRRKHSNNNNMWNKPKPRRTSQLKDKRYIERGEEEVNDYSKDEWTPPIFALKNRYSTVRGGHYSRDEFSRFHVNQARRRAPNNGSFKGSMKYNPEPIKKEFCG
jgi:hypothetical protein